MTHIKYRFEIWYQTKNLRQIGYLLKTFDLGIDGLCTKDVITFVYTAEEKPISYFKELIKQAMESCERTVLKIEGGKVE